jgi:catechol 2,3-dioxygenase-like lactoylglutathione lyase family enzyme
MNATSAASVFHVSDLERALAFYKDVLGFQETFRHGTYVGLMIGQVPLHLTLGGPDCARPTGGGTVYIFCDAVDAFYEQLAARGARLRSAPANQSYGMRDFIVHDPDGNQLSFGADLGE